MAAKVPFSIDICKETFDRLNDLLEICDPATAKESKNDWLKDNSDKICVCALKLLKLQVSSSRLLV